jgi:hypothetical protein
MISERTPEYLFGLVQELCKLPHETEWVEFKENYADAAPKMMKYVPSWAVSSEAGT